MSYCRTCHRYASDPNPCPRCAPVPGISPDHLAALRLRFPGVAASINDRDGAPALVLHDFPNDFSLSFEDLAWLSDTFQTRAINLEHEGARCYDSGAVSATTELVVLHPCLP